VLVRGPNSGHTFPVLGSSRRPVRTVGRPRSRCLGRP
jgi:hypothetical protein